jgi:hypothetical protein
MLRSIVGLMQRKRGLRARLLTLVSRLRRYRLDTLAAIRLPQTV